ALDSRANSPNPHAESVPRRAQALAEESDGFVAEPAPLGGECQGPEEGIAGFPAAGDGGGAGLCWRPDEPSVAWWHPRENGFADRRPLGDAEVLDPEAAGAARDA